MIKKKNGENSLGKATGLELLLIGFGEKVPGRGLCDRLGVSGGVIPFPFDPISGIDREGVSEKPSFLDKKTITLHNNFETFILCNLRLPITPSQLWPKFRFGAVFSFSFWNFGRIAFEIFPENKRIRRTQLLGFAFDSGRATLPRKSKIGSVRL